MFAILFSRNAKSVTKLSFYVGLNSNLVSERILQYFSHCRRFWAFIMNSCFRQKVCLSEILCSSTNIFLPEHKLCAQAQILCAQALSSLCSSTKCFLLEHDLRGVSKKFVDKCNNLFIYGWIGIKIDRKILQHSTINLPENILSGWYTLRIPRRHRNQKSLPRRNSNS